MAESEGRIALVTGAAGGVGAHISRALHSAGRRVLLGDLDVEAAEKEARSLSPDGTSAAPIKMDVSHRESFEEAVAQSRALWGETPAILVNNAAVTRAADVMSLTQKEFDEVLTTNIDSVFFGCQVLGKEMTADGFGRIVNLSSLAGQNGGTATGGHYAVSKGGILTTTKIFARELAPHGITVNALAPGPHDLPVVHRTVPSERMDDMIQSIPVGRLGDPGFLGRTAELLTSDDAAFVTGACWDVNGGLYLR